ncbi:suppressor of glycerol defect [Sporothrix curviconia]|uniref:Suppressor of glycerol defect n=1 Tax=Sporothrix curviconia TaxID=1260050 RepID=A0ABP0AP83_9PEZI
MAPPRNTGPTLSAGLLKHLGIETQGASGRGGRKNSSRPRQWKGAAAGSSQQQRQGRNHQSSADSRAPRRPTHTKPSDSSPGQAKGKSSQMRVIDPELEDDSIDEDDFDDFNPSDGEDGQAGQQSEDEEGASESETDSNVAAAAPTKISRRMREQLENDDAEIAELERKLGMKGRKNLPQTFKDDGLGDLLESLGGPGSEDAEVALKKKRKNEAEDWLRSKRQKAMGLQTRVADSDEGDDDDDEGGEDGDEGEDGDGNIFGVSDEEAGGFEGFDDDDGDSGKHQGQGTEEQQPKRVRENPYVAPVAASSAPQKYVPPALRRAQQATDSESEAVTRVRRQAHHLIARLSDANLLTILGDIEKMYLDNPRQYVTDAVTDKLLEQVQIEGALSSNVTVLIAGFATAVYMVKGTDFGANFIQQNATLFKKHYIALAEAEAGGAPDRREHSWTPSSKLALNLLALMAELYNFRMIGPNLIYDYIRMLLGNLTETSTELLLRVFETSGHRLHQDDPRALKDIVSLVQPAVLRAGGQEKLSVRTKHMIDRISDIKKNDKKKQRDAETSGFGHAERIRKVLGNLPTSRKLEAVGPLRVSLADIENSDKRGKWWLVGASWAGRSDLPREEDAAATSKTDVADGTAAGPRHDRQPASAKDDGDDVLGSWGDDIADVEELDLLAREQGMNTDARRSIFVTLLSAADSKDAHARLLRLGLNKYEKREVANVLIRCVGSEQHYNRYYALVARQVCSTDRRMAWVFQASVWKLFRRMGEPMFGEVPDDDEPDEEDEATDLQRVVNTAKLCGYLIACGSLSLDILKCLSLVRLQAKTRMFVEVLLLSFFEEAQKASKAGGESGSSSSSSSLIRRRFRAASDKDDLRRGLQYFLDKVVRKSTLVEANQASTIAKACYRAQKALRESLD